MCTVTYIPQPKGFILSSNRDESPLRSDNRLAIDNLDKHRLLYPKDSKGGSWLVTTDTGRVGCILNGGFVYHKHTPPYKMSRGIMLKEIFEYDHVSDFLRHFDLTGIEPFTLIFVERDGPYEIRWDGMTKHARSLDSNQKYVWSSSTLYTPEMMIERKEWFDSTLADVPDITLQHMKQLHRTGGHSNEHYGYIMNRENRVRTISITHVVCKEKESIVEFENLLTDEVQVKQMYYQRTERTAKQTNKVV